ncbi:MAG: inorganic phosphate transporter [Legionellaceae bacterium]|nr:inorganic phosphate transporter [Legionellaceae bacterium]
MDLSHYFFFAGVALCFFMTWGVGANDLANVMSTTIGSQSVTVKQAVIIAIVFEFTGAFFGGSGVTETLRDGIITTSQITEPTILIQGMLSVLLACTLWMNIASFLAVPVSITNALVGSMVGFGAIVLGPHAIHWGEVARIALGWVTSPLIAGFTSYLLFTSIQQTIFVHLDPLQKARQYIPIYLLLIGGLLSFITVFKGLHHFGIHLKMLPNVLIIISCSILLAMIGLYVIHRIPHQENVRRKERFTLVEKHFAVLMGLTACAMVFAHGSNDVSLAVGPLSIIYSLMNPHPYIIGNLYPAWITLLGCTGVVGGFLMYGKRVIETVGSSITTLTPSRAFAATAAASATVVIANSTGIPVSATQTLVGAVLGVGLARGIGALNLIVIRNIFLSWIVTLPVASGLSILTFEILHFFLP